MEQLRATGVDADTSGPSPHENDAGAWLVWLHLSRPMTPDETRALRGAWGSYHVRDSAPALNLPQVEEARICLRLGTPDALPEVVPKLRELLGQVQERAAAVAAQREANRQRVRDAAANIDWSV